MHVFHFRYSKIDLSLFLRDIEISQTWLDFIMSEKQSVKQIAGFLKFTDILKDVSFQQSMVDVAQRIFCLSETYCGFKMKDDREEKRKSENLKVARFISSNGYVQTDSSKTTTLMKFFMKPLNHWFRYMERFRNVTATLVASSEEWERFPK